MDKEDFMNVVYGELASDPDNCRANRIIDAADEYAESVQLGTNLAEVGTRTVRGYPIDADALMEKVAEEYGERARDTLYRIIRYMPPAQPKTATMTVGRTKGEITMWYECDNCGEPVDQSDNYCRNCGRKFRRNE